MKMDSVPEEIEVNGVKGRRFKSSRYYSGLDNMWVLDVTYRFNLKELIKAGAAKLYTKELFQNHEEAKTDE